MEPLDIGMSEVETMSTSVITIAGLVFASLLFWGIYFLITERNPRRPIVGSTLLTLSALVFATGYVVSMEDYDRKTELATEWLQSESEAVCREHALATLDGRSLVILDDDDATAHDAVLEARRVMSENLALSIEVPTSFTAGNDDAMDGFYTTIPQKSYHTVFDCYEMGYWDDIPGFQTSAQVMGWEMVRHTEDAYLWGEDA